MWIFWAIKCAETAEAESTTNNKIINEEAAETPTSDKIINKVFLRQIKWPLHAQ